MKNFAFVLLFCFVTLSLGANPSPEFIPANDRLAPRPEWETDVTELLRGNTGIPYREIMSRQARTERIRGETLPWQLDLTLPKEADPAWPVVLEADESRVFTSVKVEDQEIRFDRRDLGDLWFSGEGSALLPPANGKTPVSIKLEALDNPQAYENGFGRLRLRPATADEVLRFVRQQQPDSVQAVNHGYVPLNFTLRVVYEDYFGVLLGEETQELQVQPKKAFQVRLTRPVASTEAPLYKTRIWGEIAGRRTLEYQATENGRLITRERSHVLKLSNKWEKVFVDGPPDKFPPPATGWIEPGKQFAASDYKSHWMWARQKFTIPKNWPADQPIQILIPNGFTLSALIRLDGQVLGEAGTWELPKRLTLPSGLPPGSEHTLEFGITDYIAGLSSSALNPLPPPGPFYIRGRAFASPGLAGRKVGIGINCEPEISTVPVTRVIDVFVKTRMTPSKLLQVSAKIQNDSSKAIKGTIRMKVYESGKLVLDAGEQSYNVTSAGLKEVTFEKNWNDAKLWSPETPKLYELRTELRGSDSQIIDVRRDRFGFREVGIHGNQFTLNGEVIKLHGGSHVYTTTLTWPARPSPYRLFRHQAFAAGETGGGQTQGIISLNAADELGYLIKADSGAIGSTCADDYAWQEPQMWQRLKAQMQAVAFAYINHPSVLIWDAGNELAFKGTGEPERMAELFRIIREMDPTRYATISGSYPLVPGSDIVDFHGWGTWQNRTDYFFWRPEERPSYLKNAGYFHRQPAGDIVTTWRLDERSVGNPVQLFPGNTGELRHIGNRPVLFSEGMYQEELDTFPLYGHDAFLTTPVSPNASSGSIESALRSLNFLGNRRIAIQNVRQAGCSSFMIHGSGGTGRYLLPLASFSWDRKTRFVSASRFQTRYGVHNDLSVSGRIKAAYRLWDKDQIIGEKTQVLDLKPGDIGFVDLDFPLPSVLTDQTFRLEIRVTSTSGTGLFFDDVPITIYVPRPYKLPEGQKLGVFDPKNMQIPKLELAQVQFSKFSRLADWKPMETVLLVGSEGLSAASPEDLATLADKIEQGGRAIVLDHFSLPSFLSISLPQSRMALSYVARMHGHSSVMDGILSEDLRAWTTRERDQVVSWNPLETPSTGRFRVHATTVGQAPVLEIAQGKGRVIFAQLNFKDALGVDPAADRIFANLLRWTGEPSSFPSTRTGILSGDEKLAAGLRNRLGLDAPTIDNPDAELLVASGTSKATREILELKSSALNAKLTAGGTLFLYGMDDATAKWLSDFTGSEVEVKPFAHRFAYLTGPFSRLTLGLGHGDFWINGAGRGINPFQPLKTLEGTTGHLILNGAKVRPLTRPCYLSEIPVGEGRIIVDLIRSLESPVPSQLRILSTLLSNAGAKLDRNHAEEQSRWTFLPIDLTSFVNRSLSDSDEPGHPRGWHASGADNDMRDFPTGKQTLRVVDYFITPPSLAKNNSVIMIAGKNAKLGGPNTVTGIPINAKAERIYFLHNSAWGEPQFTYRIYYTEDRKKWIPGKPDPYVDAVVKAGENIADFFFAGRVDRGIRPLGGATVAWTGGNTLTRSTSPTGAADIGVYQMIWDNPHPEKEIESIDIISPCLEGSGNAFIFGITIGNRAKEAVKPDESKPPLSSVIPRTMDIEQVLEQVQFPSYGFVLMKNGTIGAIYDAAGRPFARSLEWNVTGSASQGQRSQIVAQAKDSNPDIKSITSGSRREWTFTSAGKDSSLPVETRITVKATPGSLRYELRYTPSKGIKTAKLRDGLYFLGNAKPVIQVNQNPFSVKTTAGEIVVGFDRRYTRVVFSYQVFPDRFELISPPQDGAPWQAGREESLWWEITSP